MAITTRDVKSIAKSGSAKLKGDVTLSESTNITLTQSGQDISIAASGSADGTYLKYRLFGTANNRFYTGKVFTSNGAAQGQSPFADAVTCLPFPTSQSIVLDRIAIDVVTAQASGLARIGIYDSNASFYPANLIVDSGNIDCSSTGIKSIVISETLSTNSLYWLAFNYNNSGISLRGINGAVTYGFFGLPATLLTGAPNTDIRISSAFGALPDPFTAGGTIGSTMQDIVYVRILS